MKYREELNVALQVWRSLFLLLTYLALPGSFLTIFENHFVLLCRYHMSFTTDETTPICVTLVRFGFNLLSVLIKKPGKMYHKKGLKKSFIGNSSTDAPSSTAYSSRPFSVRYVWYSWLWIISWTATRVQTYDTAKGRQSSAPHFDAMHRHQEHSLLYITPQSLLY